LGFCAAVEAAAALFRRMQAARNCLAIFRTQGLVELKPLLPQGKKDEFDVIRSQVVS
jgi:hypothetical protein